MYLVPNKISGNSIPHFAKRDKEKRGRCTKCCVQQPLLGKVSRILFQFKVPEALLAAELAAPLPLPPGPPLLPPPDT